MRVPNSYRRRPMTFNMTPMIDVVFLLIIFFLVSSHLVKQEAQLPLPLPFAASGPAAVDQETPRVIINVLPSGQIQMAGRKVTPEAIQARLKEQLEVDGTDLEVRIRSDRQVPYRQVEPILLHCARAGVWNVTFAVYQEKSKQIK